MSKLTKAELETENELLHCENDNLRDNLRECHDLMDWYLKNLRLSKKVNADAIEQLVKKSDAIFDAWDNSRSEAGRHAANTRHELPTPTVQALKKEYTRVRELLTKEKGEKPRPTTVYKEISKLLWRTNKHWRRIRTQVKKDTKK